MDILIIVGLIVLSIFFLVVEILILPGFSIGGVLAAVCCGGSIYLAFDSLGSLGGIVVVVINIALFMIALFYSLRAKTWSKLSLNDKITSYSSTKPQDILNIGDQGVAVSRLSPMGRVCINNMTYEAKSTDEYIDAKTAVEVVGFENFSVIVKLIK